MKPYIFIACLASLLGGSCVASSTQTSSAPAPPWKCEIRLSAWCIAEGAYEIKRQLAGDGIHDRIWYMRGRFKPESTLIVLEPNGCGDGFSDSTELVKFDKAIIWNGRPWDQLILRLKSNTSCDLTILFPPDNGDPMEWAFTSGLSLVRPCRDDACNDEGLDQIKSGLLKARHKSN